MSNNVDLKIEKDGEELEVSSSQTVARGVARAFAFAIGSD